MAKILVAFLLSILVQSAFAQKVSMVRSQANAPMQAVTEIPNTRILLWLVISDKFHVDEILGNTSADPLLTKILMEAKKHHINLKFPKMDFKDIRQVTAID